MSDVKLKACEMNIGSPIIPFLGIFDCD